MPSTSARPDPAVDHEDVSPPSAADMDVSTALHNAMTLGASLVLTWSVALFLRFLLPRYLGPLHFGEYAFSDSFAATYLVFLSLGIDTYISKELTVRPAHASDFFGGVVALRIAMGVPLALGLVATLILTGRPPSLRSLVLVFAAGQVLVSANGTLSAMLQAHTTVGGLAVVNVVTKILWGLGTLAGLFLGAPLVVLASVLMVTELIKTVVLYRLVSKSYDLRVRLDVRALKLVLVASFPFFVNGVVLTLNSKLDITLLEFLTNDEVQVGWYSAGQNITGLSMMLSPILVWVVMPLMSRAAARSREELLQIFRRAVESVYVITLPAILMVWLGADDWVRWLFGPAYAPAAMVVRALSPVFLFTYLAMLLSMTLIVLGRSWLLTAVSAGGLVINVVMTIILVPLGARVLGPGGAGVGDAAAVVFMEVLVSAALITGLGRDAFDARLLRALGRTLVPCVVVACMHFALHALGPVRLALDVLVYAIIAFAVGAPSVGDVKGLIRLVKMRRRGAVA